MRKPKKPSKSTRRALEGILTKARKNSDVFYSIFRRIPGGEQTNQHSRAEAEKRARKYAEREQGHEFFVTMTVTKFVAKKPAKIEIIRTEIKP